MRSKGVLGGAIMRAIFEDCLGRYLNIVLIIERNVRDYAAGFDYTKISIDIYILADALLLIL